MKLLILSGPPGAGKSTISKVYAQQKSHCVRIETDDVRQMVITPHKAPWEGEEGMRQLLLGVNNVCLLTKQFIASGFDVIIVDFVTDKTFSIYKDLLKEYNPYLVQLFPDLNETKKRFYARKETITEDEWQMLYDIQVKFTQYDLQIDNTSLSAQEVTNHLLKLEVK